MSLNLRDATQMLLESPCFGRNNANCSPMEEFRRIVSLVTGDPENDLNHHTIGPAATTAKKKLTDLAPELAAAIKSELEPQIENEEDSFASIIKIGQWILDNDNKGRFDKELKGLTL